MKSWLYLSLGCAFFTALAAAFSKLLLRKNNIYFVGWIRFLVSAPILFAVVVALRPSFSVLPGFWKTVAILLPFELAAFLLYLEALKVSPLSLTFPLLGFTPVFSVLASFLVLREKLSAWGIGGVALVTLGAYLLNADTLKYGALQPIKSIYKEKGSLLMFVVAFIYGITSSLGKRAVLLSNPLAFPALYYAIFFFVLLPLVLIKRREIMPLLDRRDILLSLALGISFALAILLHFKAISLVKVSYMVSAKRLSLLISVALGAIVFKEKNIGFRFLGASVMIAGVLVLSLWG